MTTGGSPRKERTTGPTSLAWLDAAVPPDVVGEKRQRGELFVAVSGLAGAAALLPVVARMRSGDRAGAALWAVLLLTSAALAVAFRRGAHLDRVAGALLWTATCVFTALVVATGGHQSPGLWWIVLLPGLAGALLEGVGSRVMGGVAGVTAAVVCGAGAVGLPLSPVGLPPGGPAEAGASLILVAGCAALVLRHERRAAAAVDLPPPDATAPRPPPKPAPIEEAGHELRAPVQAMIGLTQMLIDDAALAPRHRALLGTVHERGRSLLTLIDGLVDRSRPEVSAAMRPEAIAADVVASLREEAARKGLAVALYAEGTGWSMGDPVGLKQALLHLVGHAVRAAGKGSVELRLSQRQERLRVDLFAPATPSDAARGLDLAISGRIVERLGGVLSGEGSGFSFEVPAPRCAPPHAEVSAERSPSLPPKATAGERPVVAEPPPSVGPVGAPSPAPPPVHAGPPADDAPEILIAEDNRVNRMVIQGMVTRLGYRVVMVENGDDAVRALVAEPDRFAAVLMDWHMPVLDGVDATRRARAAGVRTPIVAVSASTQPQERMEALAAGMTGFVAKPLVLQQLHDALMQAVLSR